MFTPINDGKIAIHCICEDTSDAALPMLQKVLRMNPDHAKKVTSTGLLPLHLAILNEKVSEPIRMEMIKLLVTSFPASVEQLYTFHQTMMNLSKEMSTDDDITGDLNLPQQWNELFDLFHDENEGKGSHSSLQLTCASMSNSVTEANFIQLCSSY